MAKRVDKETFWYEATVMRMRGKTACHRKQQGSLQATSGLDALDQLEAKAKNTWRGTIIRAKVCEVDANGEIIATTESNEKSQDVTYDKQKTAIWEWATPWNPPTFRTYKG